MRPQARKAKADGFPVPAADRTHVPIETKDFLSVLDLTHDELDRILDLAAELKRDRTEGRTSMQPLAGKHIGLIFEKPSLRTRTTFTIAIRELGGEVIEPRSSVVFEGRETLEDVARNFERWLAARTIANSPLVKTALNGGDPNWGRLVAAAGRSGAAFVLDKASVAIGPVQVFVSGVPHDERADEAAEVMKAKEITVAVDLGTGGSHAAKMWTCDFSAEYVRINAEYRT